jgi:hypothetical protein
VGDFLVQQMVIVLEGDNKYKEDNYRKGEVPGETREWLDIRAFELDEL